MAVYTPVSDADLALFLSDYDLGRALACKGIAEGIENSNFLLETERGRFILTLYEGRTAAGGDLAYFLDLMSWLSVRDFPCPTPQPDRNGATLKVLNGRPAALVSFLPGLSVSAASVAQCRATGEGLARMHLAAEGFAGRRANALGPAAWRPLFEAHHAAAARLDPALPDRIAADLARLEAGWPTELPGGTVHADLFPDNVFFDRNRFAGAIDFYFACDDLLAYDLAITLCAWAFTPAPRFAFDPARAAALLGGYDAARPLSPAERAALPVLALGAAMRFFLTRLADWETTPAGALVTRKDPMEYATKLDHWRAALARGEGL